MAEIKVGVSEGEETAEHGVVGFEEDLSDVVIPAELPILPLRGVVTNGMRGLRQGRSDSVRAFVLSAAYAWQESLSQ